MTETATPKAMTTYPFDQPGADRTDPALYENRPEEHDTATATAWVLHLRVMPDQEQTVLDAMALEAKTTGAYLSGDSWLEWGEERGYDTDFHMGVYFESAPGEAKEAGFTLAAHLIEALTKAGAKNVYGWKAIEDLERGVFAVSTAGDFAELVY